MRSLIIPLLLLLAAIPLVIALLRANELFLVHYRGGRIRVARGRIPQALLNDLADVLRSTPTELVALKGVVEDQRVRVYAEGELTEAQRQQIRNVISGWPVAKIRNAPKRR
jgi:hypothetical protein